MTTAAPEKLSFADATFATVVMNTGLRWLPVAAAVGPAALPLWIVALLTFFAPLAAATVELTSRFEGEGGIYMWTRQTFGSLAGFLCGWFYWFAVLPYFAGIIYFVAGLLMAAVGADQHDTALFLAFAVGIAVLVTSIQFAGLSVSKWVPNLGTAATWTIFFALVAIASVLAAKGLSATSFVHASYIPPMNFDTAILWGTIVFAYSGIEAVAFMRDEIEGGLRTVLKVVAIVGVAAATVYIVGTASMLVILPVSQMTRLGGFADVLHAVFTRAGTPWLEPAVLLFLAFSMLGGFTAWFSASTRLLVSVGGDKYLPAAIAYRNPKTGAPTVAILAQGTLMLVMLILGQAGASAAVAYDFLVSMGILTNTLCYVFVFAAYVISIRKAPAAGAWRPAGGASTGIVLGVVGMITTWIAIICTLIPSGSDPNPMQTFIKLIGAAGAMVVTGLLLYWLGSRRAVAANATA